MRRFRFEGPAAPSDTFISNRLFSLSSSGCGTYDGNAARLNNLASLPSKPTEQKFEVMKRALMITTTLAVLGSSVVRTDAGNQEWATAGKVMAGVGAGLLIATALQPRPVYAEPAPVIVQQPAQVVYQPATQVVVQQQPTVVYTQPTVVYTQPAVVYQPAPVIVRPAPVVYAPVCAPPVYYRPRPVVGFHISLGHHHHHRRHGHR